MASFNKFQSWVEFMVEAANLQSDDLKVLLTNGAPNAATHSLKADLTEISAGNGYSAGGPSLTITSRTQSGGTYKLVADDLVITASGGDIGPFQWIVLYDDTVANDPLIGFWNYGSALTLTDGSSLTLDFSASNGVLQVT